MSAMGDRFTRQDSASVKRESASALARRVREEMREAVGAVRADLTPDALAVDQLTLQLAARRQPGWSRRNAPT
jgi:hypothetical protein